MYLDVMLMVYPKDSIYHIIIALMLCDKFGYNFPDNATKCGNCPLQNWNYGQIIQEFNLTIL